MNNRNLAELIVSELNKKGAGLGDFAISIVKKVLDEQNNPPKAPNCKCNAYQLENYGCKCGASLTKP